MAKKGVNHISATTQGDKEIGSTQGVTGAAKVEIEDLFKDYDFIAGRKKRYKEITSTKKVGAQNYIFESHLAFGLKDDLGDKLRSKSLFDKLIATNEVEEFSRVSKSVVEYRQAKIYKNQLASILSHVENLRQESLTVFKAKKEKLPQERRKEFVENDLKLREQLAVSKDFLLRITKYIEEDKDKVVDQDIDS